MSPNGNVASRSALGIAVIAAIGLIGFARADSEPPGGERPGGEKAPPWQRIVRGDDATRVEKLEKSASELEKAGRFEEALVLAREILRIRETAQGADHWQSVAASIRIATYAQAQTFAAADQSALAAAFREHEEGEALIRAGRRDEAAAMHRSALAAFERLFGAEHAYTARSCNNLAGALGSLWEVEALVRRALAIYLRVYRVDHPNTAACCHNLASVLTGRGRFAEATLLYQKSLSIWRNTRGDSDPLTAHGYNTMGCSLLGQGKAAEAEPLFRKAIAIWTAALGENSPQTAQGHGNLAICLAGSGNWTGAEMLFRKQFDIDCQTIGKTHPSTAQAARNLGNCLVRMRKLDEAEALLRSALLTYQVADGEPSGTTSLGYRDLALVLYAEGKDDEAVAMARAAAKSYESARLRLGLTGTLSVESATKLSPEFVAAVLLASPARATEAWGHWEAGLARGLLDDLEIKRLRPFSLDERARQDTLTTRLTTLENLIAALSVTADRQETGTTRLEECKQEQMALRLEQSQLEADLVKKYGVTAGEVYNLGTIQESLRADQALVGWLDLEDHPSVRRPGDHWVCVVRRTGAPRWFPVPGRGPGGSWTDDDGARPARVAAILRSGSDQNWRPALAELAADRITPMLPALAANGELPAVRHLIVLPSPALSGIPIEALIEARPLPDPPLLVSYAPSGTTFAWLSERRRDTRRGGDRSRRLLALGDPVPRVESDAKPLDHNRQSSQPLGSHIDSDRELQINRDAEFEPLPASRAEVSAIANLFDHPQVFLGSDASEQTLDAMRANGQLAGFDVIHLAAHGKADEISLFNCRLLLAQDRLPDPLRVFKAGERFCDGVLTAGEVLGTWKIDAEIVTLSACRSGVGRQGGGEGFVGFAQAFFLAGAQSLLVSLWEVDDQATSLLMTRFYENWLGKRADLHGPLTKAASLDEAKRWLRGLTTAEVEHALERNTRGEIRHRPRQRQGRPFAHPHDWAGFILMGNAS